MVYRNYTKYYIICKSIFHLWYFLLKISPVVVHCWKLHISLEISIYANINEELQMYLRIWYPISSMSWSRKHLYTPYDEDDDGDSSSFICCCIIILFIFNIFKISIILNENLRRLWFKYHFKVDITKIKDIDYTTMFKIIKLKNDSLIFQGCLKDTLI